MNKLLITGFFIFCLMYNTQAQTPAQVHETAMNFVRTGDFDNANIAITNALAKDPNNYELLKEQLTVAYLKKDYAKTVELGKKLINHANVDAQAFQVLGTTYKMIAQDKAAYKTYEDGIAKFPEQGVLRNEYAELLTARKNDKEAIKQWELSIEKDPNYSASYYYAAKYYGEKSDLIWAIYYGETFINLESLSKRSVEMKELLLQWYKKIYAQPNIAIVYASKNNFANMIAATLAKQTSAATAGITPESLTTIREGFVKDWFNPDNAKYFTVRLFEHWQQLIKLNHFKAYNLWVFGAAANTDAYTQWIENNKQVNIAFQNFQGGKIFKIPAGQYYQTK